jgi:hypothetical protein
MGRQLIKLPGPGLSSGRRRRGLKAYSRGVGRKSREVEKKS